jgi:hypothetical protein
METLFWQKVGIVTLRAQTCLKSPFRLMPYGLTDVIGQCKTVFPLQKPTDGVFTSYGIRFSYCLRGNLGQKNDAYYIPYRCYLKVSCVRERYSLRICKVIDTVKNKQKARSYGRAFAQNAIFFMGGIGLEPTTSSV